MFNNFVICNFGESEKNIYVEYINFNKEIQIVMMDYIFFLESYEIFMLFMVCVWGIEKFIMSGENNFVLIYYYWWGLEIVIVFEFDVNGSRIMVNFKVENLIIVDVFFDEYGEVFVEEFYNKQGFI